MGILFDPPSQRADQFQTSITLDEEEPEDEIQDPSRDVKGGPTANIFDLLKKSGVSYFHRHNDVMGESEYENRLLELASKEIREEREAENKISRRGKSKDKDKDKEEANYPELQLASAFCVTTSTMSNKPLPSPVYGKVKPELKFVGAWNSPPKTVILIDDDDGNNQPKGRKSNDKKRDKSRPRPSWDDEKAVF